MCVLSGWGECRRLCYDLTICQQYNYFFCLQQLQYYSFIILRVKKKSRSKCVCMWALDCPSRRRTCGKHWMKQQNRRKNRIFSTESYVILIECTIGLAGQLRVCGKAETSSIFTALICRLHLHFRSLSKRCKTLKKIFQLQEYNRIIHDDSYTFSDDMVAVVQTVGSPNAPQIDIHSETNLLFRMAVPQPALSYRSFRWSRNALTDLFHSITQIFDYRNTHTNPHSQRLSCGCSRFSELENPRTVFSSGADERKLNIPNMIIITAFIVRPFHGREVRTGAAECLLNSTHWYRRKYFLIKIAYLFQFLCFSFAVRCCCCFCRGCCSHVTIKSKYFHCVYSIPSGNNKQR